MTALAATALTACDPPMKSCPLPNGQHVYARNCNASPEQVEEYKVDDYNQRALPPVQIDPNTGAAPENRNPLNQINKPYNAARENALRAAQAAENARRATSNEYLKGTYGANSNPLNNPYQRGADNQLNNERIDQLQQQQAQPKYQNPYCKRGQDANGYCL